MGDNREVHRTGEELDSDLLLILNAPKFSAVEVEISKENWLNSPTGEWAKYYLNITLQGTYYDKYVPVVYFVDQSGMRYDTEYVYNIISSNSIGLKIYSNIQKPGKIIIKNQVNAWHIRRD